MNLVLPLPFKRCGVLPTRRPQYRLRPPNTHNKFLLSCHTHFSTQSQTLHQPTGTHHPQSHPHTPLPEIQLQKPELQPQTQPEGQPEVQASQPQPEVQAQAAQPELQPQSQPQPEVQAAQPQPELQPQSQPEVQPAQPEVQPTQPVQPQPQPQPQSQPEPQATPAASKPTVPYFTQLSKRSKHISYLQPETKISNLEEEISYPVRIVGTRKSSKRMFWTWDSFYSIFLKSKSQPKLYLTFEDSNGKVIGPVMYNTKLTGRGFQLGLGWRCLLGNISGEIENTYFNQIPRQLSVTGSDTSFYTFSAFCGYSFTRLAFDEIPGIKVSYFGPSLFGALGYVSIKKGYLEAEPHIKSIGLPPLLEYLGKIIVALVFLIGIFLTIVPILYPLGVLDPLIERLARL